MYLRATLARRVSGEIRLLNSCLASSITRISGTFSVGKAWHSCAVQLSGVTRSGRRTLRLWLEESGQRTRSGSFLSQGFHIPKALTMRFAIVSRLRCLETWVATTGCGFRFDVQSVSQKSTRKKRDDKQGWS